MIGSNQQRGLGHVALTNRANSRWSAVSETLVENPVLLLFLVIGVGYLVGQVRYRGFGLGVGAVLFAGLIAGGIDNALVIPPVFLDLGLALFVYTIGLAAGPGFVASLRRRGLRANALVLVVLAAMTGLAVGLAELCGFSGPTTAGIFSGALTNTPALASSVATLTSKGLPSTAPVVSYSLCYPVGGIGVLLAVSFYRRRFFKQPVEDSLVTHTVVVGADLDRPLNQIAADENLDVRFVRVAHDGTTTIVHEDDADTDPAIGDHVSIVGTASDVVAMTDLIGSHIEETTLFDERGVVDHRRIFVSRPSLAGKRISDLDLHSQFGATVTRVRRGDQDMLVHDDFILLLGDRVRVVAPPKAMKKIDRFFGDSYRHLSEIDMASFGIGLTLGLLLGLVPIPLPGTVLHLGNAGGPLIMGLILGGLRRTWPFTWDPSFSANLTLRQFGVVLFLAGIGTKAGPGFFTALSKGTTVLPIVGAGMAITFAMALSFLWIGHKFLKVAPDELTGMLAAAQTQPAVLAFAVEMSDDERPNVGYSAVYPMAMVFKILAVQIILLVLGMHS